ncbi:Preprotein translocase subunit YidC [metagenome]|uniref:Preprotein translocase subunit YidC n=1 Tax=metagenome TaxID=256318 RepID=A0A2P2C2V6_9ZZZZ
MSFLGDIGGAIMAPLYYVTSAVLVGWHWVWSLIFPAESGAAWALSIVGLTLVIRAALIPLFVKQIKSSRNMQLLQPKVKELQKKYGHDREKLAAETMALYKETGTNPFASCLPLLLQMPIFFALFRLIDQAAKKQTAHSFLTEDLAKQFANAELFGVKISQSFTNADHVGVQIMAGILVVAMTLTTFLTQRQLMSKNMPPDAMTGPYAQQQKMLLYVLPLVFAVGGIAFPVGVLLYWTTSNLWTMTQQFYVIRNNPAPGTPAEQAKLDRDAAKAAKHGHPPVKLENAEEPAPPPPPPPVRQQPKRQPRSQRGKQQPPGKAPKKRPSPPSASSGENAS